MAKNRIVLVYLWACGRCLDSKFYPSRSDAEERIRSHKSVNSTHTPKVFAVFN